MSKQYRCITSSANRPCTEQSDQIIWKLCILCQCDAKEQLQIPCPSTRTNDRGVGYASIAQHIIQFNDLNAMPSTFKLNVDKLDGGSGIEDTLRSHSAAWHKSCRNKINNLKLDRALKRNQDVLPVYFSPIKIRRLN